MSMKGGNTTGEHQAKAAEAKRALGGSDTTATSVAKKSSEEMSLAVPDVGIFSVDSKTTNIMSSLEGFCVTYANARSIMKGDSIQQEEKKGKQHHVGGSEEYNGE